MPAALRATRGLALLSPATGSEAPAEHERPAGARGAELVRCELPADDAGERHAAHARLALRRLFPNYELVSLSHRVSRAVPINDESPTIAGLPNSGSAPLDVTTSNALRVSDAYACVRLLADSVSSLPLHV
jgi:hypothetical protein